MTDDRPKRIDLDPIEVHRAVHQAASHELDMGTTWKPDRVQAFAGRIAKRVVDVVAADQSEADRLRAALARVERLAEELSRDTHATGGSGVGPFIAQEIRNRIAGVAP